MSFGLFTNADAVTQQKGMIVRRGATGSACLLAQADTAAHRADLLGTRYASVAAGSSGFVSGFEDGCWVKLDAAAPSGSVIYLSDTTPGIGTATPPVSFILPLGYAYQVINEGGGSYAVVKAFSVPFARTDVCTWAVGTISVDPTGATDSYPGLQALLNAGNLLVPPGTYKLLQTLSVPANTSMHCMKGARFVLGADNIGGIALNGDYAEVTGAEVDGTGRASTLGGIGVYAQYCNVERCYVHDLPGGAAAIGIVLDGQATTTRYANVCRNVVKNVAGCGISLHTVTGAKVESNIIETSGIIGLSIYNSLTGYYAGNRISSSQQEGLTCDVSSFSRIVGNSFTTSCINVGVGAADGAVSFDNSVDCVFAGNFIRGCTKPGVVTNNALGPASLLSITGNVIVDCTTYGIYIRANAGVVSVRCMIAGNVFVGGVTNSIRFDAGCDNNEARYNQLNGLAVSDAGAGNTY